MHRVLVALLLVVLGASCGSSDENDCPIGRWKAEEVDLSDAHLGGGPWYLIHHVYEFRTDSSFTSEGKYRRKGVVEEHSNSGTYYLLESLTEPAAPDAVCAASASHRC